MARGEYNYKQIGPPMLEETVGDATYRLFAEGDGKAEDPKASIRIRFGRVFNPGQQDEFVKSPSVATFTGSNADALLELWPKVLAIVAKYKSKLPSREPARTRGKVRDETLDALASSLFGDKPAAAAQAPARPSARAKANRPF